MGTVTRAAALVAAALVGSAVVAHLRDMASIRRTELIDQGFRAGELRGVLRERDRVARGLGETPVTITGVDLTPEGVRITGTVPNPVDAWGAQFRASYTPR